MGAIDHHAFEVHDLGVELPLDLLSLSLEIFSAGSLIQVNFLRRWPGR